jgi:hypothetical protein
VGALACGVDGERLDDELAALIPETEAGAVGIGEALAHVFERAEGDGEGSVRAFVAKVERGVRVGGRDALGSDFAGCFVREARDRGC